MGMGMGYGSPMGGGMLSGPMHLIYSINYFIMSLGQVCEMVGISAQSIVQLARTAVSALGQLEVTVRQSELRRWMQRKCRRSRALRLLFMLAAMALSFQASRLAQQLLGRQIGAYFTSPSPSSSSDSSSVSRMLMPQDSAVPLPLPAAPPSPSKG